MSHDAKGFRETMGRPMQIGYARSSTVDQETGYQAQMKTLKAAGCDKIFAEKVSSIAHRISSKLQSIMPGRVIRL